MAGGAPRRRGGPVGRLHQHPGDQRLGRHAARARVSGPAQASGQRHEPAERHRARLVGTVGFYRRMLVDWRKVSLIAVLVGLGIIVGSLVAVELGEAVLDGVVTAGLLFVLGLLLVEPGR
jgi:hypothetical protein